MTVLELSLSIISLVSVLALTFIAGYWQGTNNMVHYYNSLLRNSTKKSYNNPTQDDFDRIDDAKNDTGYLN